ncbi:MAG: glycosyltransferase family 4 protein [Chitinispirillales bacterium]|jgi:glycosyltransferase involved in cell wall biosynthesis|nr:glycosyltransferase family 4 protein [Chitinispirillales bacterium]
MEKVEKIEKIKILHIYKSFNVFNGLIEILTIMAQDLDHKRFELGVCVFEYEGNSFGEKFEKLGGKIFNLDVQQKALNEPKSFSKLVSFLKSYKPHVVQTHVLKANLMGSAAARLAGVPVIIGTEMTLKDTAPSSFGRLRDRILQPFTSAALKGCDSFVVTSEFIKKEWENGLKQNAFKVIYPPFNLEKLNASANVRETHGKEIKKIGFIGRLSDEKSIDKLLEAMKMVSTAEPNSKLCVVGTGPLENKLKQQCGALGLEKAVEFTGYKANVFEALRGFDLFVLSSRTEGCPIVILEAMAAGLAVVATDVGGNPELVEDGKTGILVRPNCPHSIASALIALLKDKSRAQKMGEAGQKRAFTVFHPSKFTASLQELYMELYNKKRPHSQLAKNKNAERGRV